MPVEKVKANGLSLWTESFGNPKDSPLLLIAGAAAQAIFWEDEFCQALADGRRFVIRYDNRDTGQSDSVDFASAPYTVSDMADDAVGILDAYGISRAHVVGVSLGGLICQALGLEHRDRIVTMTTLISSLLGTGSSEVENGGYGDLPPPSAQFLEGLQDFVTEVPEESGAFVAWTLRKYQLIAGSLATFDPVACRVQAEREFDRADNLQAMNNHALAAAGSSAAGRTRLNEIDVPTLVVHGTDDPMLPYPHGQAIAKAIPGARLVSIDKMGHDLPRAAWPEIIAEILAHTNQD